MLDIMGKDESLRNDVDILDSIINVCLFKVNGSFVNCQVMRLSLTNEKWEMCYGAWTSTMFCLTYIYVKITMFD